MQGKNIPTDLKHKLEVKTCPYLLQQKLLIHYSSLRQKSTLCQFLHGLTYGGLQSFFSNAAPYVFTTTDNQ